jgi:hypothetical protein
MKLEELRDSMHAAPFRPFIIYIAEGGAREVPRPDFITLMGGRTALWAPRRMCLRHASD